MRRFLLTTAMTFMCHTALADDAALILGVERYTTLGRVVQGASIQDSVAALRAAGFETHGTANANKRNSKASAARFLAAIPDADRAVVALSGRFVTDGQRAWFLPADAAEPTMFQMGNLLSVDSLLAIMAARAGNAVLVLGIEDDDTRYGPYLRAGIGDLHIPQGVTVVRGAPRDVDNFLSDVVAEPGANLVASARNNRRISVSGYTPRNHVLIPMATAASAMNATPRTRPVIVNTAADEALWRRVRESDTSATYRHYLETYPRGLHAAEAQQLLAEILNEPHRAARLAEERLALSRSARRNIQRNLSLLSFNPRGVDGIFGPGSRSAIANWQQQNGFSQTTYLNPEQINRLDAQASLRAAELEAEAERARAAALRLDRAFWEETGARRQEAGYRAYLGRYPDGEFAQTATRALARIAEEKRATAMADDRDAWDRASTQDTLRGYRAYLREFPQGSFAQEANARISRNTAANNNAQANAAARAAETALGLNRATRRMVETRLARQELQPGPVDGEFTTETRRAIRRYQRDRALTVSGFLDQATLVRMLAEVAGN